MKIGSVVVPNCKECTNKAFCKYYECIRRKMGNIVQFGDAVKNNVSSIFADNVDMSAFTVTVKCIHYSDRPSMTIKRPDYHVDSLLKQDGFNVM